MNKDPLTRRNAGLLVIGAFLTVFIAGAAIYYRSPKILVGLIAPLYLVFIWLKAAEDTKDGVVKEQIVSCVSVVPYAVSRGIKASFMDEKHNFFNYVIEGGRREMFILGATYRLWYNSETGRYITSELYNAEDETRE